MARIGLTSICILVLLFIPSNGFYGFDMFDFFDLGGFYERRYGCQTEGGSCLDMYPSPAAAAAGAGGGEAPEVEMEGPQTPAPAPPPGHKRTPGAHGAHAKPTAATPPPRRLVSNPFGYIRQRCVSFEMDMASCGHNGGVCCYQAR